MGSRYRIDMTKLELGALMRRVARAMTLVPAPLCERMARRSCEIVEDYQGR